MTTVALSSPASRHLRGVLTMLLSTLCFTVNVLLIRALGTSAPVNVWLVSTVRFTVGILVVKALYRREAEFGRLFRSRRLAVRGIIGSAAVYAYYLTVVHLGAGRATFINNTYVISGAVMAVWILGEKFRPALVVGSVAALAGLALLTHAFDQGAHASGYDALAIVAAFGSAYVVVTIRQLHAEGEHTGTIFAAQCVYGLLICGIPALFARGASLGIWLTMILAGVFAAVGQIAMTFGFRDLPVAEGSLLQILVPLGIAAGGTVFFHEHFSSPELLGGGLILAGAAFTAWRR